jgi:transcriptional regulator with XRE-family HTH domain
MARSTPIDGFAEKLRLALGRANLSRTALAQRVGMDKSVVARWSSGALNPADHSLAALSAALGAAIPGFDRTAWDLPMAGFAARIGVAAPARPSGTAPALADSALDFALDLTAGSVEQAAAIYAGIWLELYPAMGRPGELAGFAGRLRLLPGQPALSFEFTNGGTVHAVGHAFAIHVRLNCVYRSLHLRDTLSFTLLDGVHDEKAEILDGIKLSRSAGVDRVIGAGRAIWLRLSDATDDATYAAAVARSQALNLAQAWESLATPPLRQAFAASRSDAGEGLRQILVAPAETWAVGHRGLRRPEAAPQREALAALRAPYRGVLPEPSGPNT